MSAAMPAPLVEAAAAQEPPHETGPANDNRDGGGCDLEMLVRALARLAADLYFERKLGQPEREPRG